jgi:AcrR family transcriptional regulator
MRHFAEHGFERATIRGIAESAGVSSGLVRHHFGSKQALRDACDQWLLRMIRRLNDQLLEDIRDGEMRTEVAAARAAMVPYQSYLARALAEGSAGVLFDEMVTMTEQWFAVYDPDHANVSEVDRRSRAALITAMGLAVGMLYPHLSRAMGVDLTTPEGDQLLSRTLLHVYSHPLLTPEEAAMMRAGLEKQERGDPR